jgi:predicted CXXCH cytochrome family protein
VVVALGLPLGWAGWALFANPAPSRYSPGPVARAHAAWDNECAACHRPHSAAIEADATLGVRGRWRDFTCARCHGGADHVADTPLTPEECAGCHRDHGGRARILTDLTDAACTRCHADLAATHPARRLHTANRVSDFQSHPEFRKLDPSHPHHPRPERKLKFSHSLHMAPGLSYAKDAPQPLTLADLPPPYQELYRRRGPGGEGQKNEPVRLECASCHRLDSRRAGAGALSEEDRARLGDLPAEALLPVRAAGHSMLPVSYDLHCKGCHPLRTKVGDGRGASYGLDPPHRVQPAEMRGWLTKELTAQVLLGRGGRQKDRQLGGRLDPREQDEVRESVAGYWLGLASRNLFRPTGVCARCHVITPGAEGQQPPKVEPPGVPTVWLENARFSHTAHRAVDCAECHPGKEARWQDGRTVVVEREPVGILGVASCRRCHGPPAAGGAGVRHGCTDCHRYHNGPNPLQGRGAEARDPAPDPARDGKSKWSIREWLGGGR